MINQKYLIPNAFLWASAILASAIVGAPHILSLFLLPILACCSFLVTAGYNCRSVRKSE